MSDNIIINNLSDDKKEQKQQIMELLEKSDNFIFLGANAKENEECFFTAMYVAKRQTAINLLLHLMAEYFPELL